MRALAAELCQQGTSVTHDTAWRFVRRQELTPKKRGPRSPPNRSGLPSPASAGAGEPINIGSIRTAETWIRTNMTRLRGWCPRDAPLRAKVPHGSWYTLTFIAGLRRTEIVTPCVFDGPINGGLFTAWVKQSLAPILRPRDVVVLDKLCSHKGHRARDAVRAAGAHLLFLPAYSPDLNPIEMVFANSPPASPTGCACQSLKPAPLKTLFRKADRRTVEDAWREVSSLLDRFSPTKCAAYLRHAGYGAITP